MILFLGSIPEFLVLWALGGTSAFPLLPSSPGGKCTRSKDHSLRIIGLEDSGALFFFLDIIVIEFPNLLSCLIDLK